MDVVPLGDAATLARCRDEAAAFRLAAAVRAAGWDGVVDVVQAYTTVAVFFDLDQTVYRAIAERLNRLTVPETDAPPAGRLHVIPCCYELGPDLDHVAAHARLGREEVIALHAGSEYTVYAIGFCPGFPYLGYLPTPLCGVPRRETPRLRVEEGSVGLTGRQTGIYTQPLPGGWNLIGRTPLRLVDVASGYFPLETGDRVRFQRIDAAEFRRLEGQRAP